MRLDKYENSNFMVVQCHQFRLMFTFKIFMGVLFLYSAL